MADDRFSAGLTDQDELSQYPSAANPLTALGIDPDEARANPDLLAALNPNAAAPAATPPPTPATVPGGVGMPGSTPDPATSAKTAGEVGGAGDASPASTTPTTLTDYTSAGLGTVDQSAKAALQAAQQMPTSSPEVDRLTAQRKQFAAPAPLYDQQTGKMLSQTTEIDPKTGQPVTIDPKPTMGTRIWRGVRGGLNGLLTGGIRGGLLGAIEPAMEGSQAYGAPSDAYQRAEQTRTGALTSTDQQIDTARTNLKNAADAIKARQEAFTKAGDIADKQVTGAVGAQNAATATQKLPIEKQTADAATLEAQNRTPQAEADKTTRQMQARTEVGKRLGLTGTALARFAANQAPEQFAPNAELVINQQSREAFRAKYGHYPQTPDEEREARQSTSAGTPKGGDGGTSGDDQVGSIVADATAKKQEYADQWVRQADGSYTTKDFTKRISAQQFQDKLDQFRTDANVKLAKKGAQIDAQGNVVHTGEKSGEPATNAESDVVTVRDGNGNVGTLPRANLATAQKRDSKLVVVSPGN